MIGWGRRNGKTTKMIMWWLVDPENRVVVCPNFTMRQHVFNRLRDLIPTSLTEERWKLAQHQFQAGTDRLRGFHGDIGVDDYDMLPSRQRVDLAQHPRFKVYTVNDDPRVLMELLTVAFQDHRSPAPC